MAKATCTAALLILLAAAGPLETAASSSRVSPVQKVVQLIDDMAAKVKKEDDELIAGFEEYAKFCDDEATEKTYSIKDSKESIEEFSATVLESQGTIETETAKTGDLSTKISDLEAEVSEAVALRKSEKETFMKAEKELVETTEELSGAQEAIKKSMALIQTRGGKVSSQDRQVLNAVIESLGQIVEASFVTQKQKDHIAALLQSRADAEEDAEYSLSAHTMNVDAIMETLADMEDKSEASLNEARKGETEAQQSHDMLKQGLENEIANSKKEMSESTKAKAAAEQTLAEATGDLAAEKKGLSEDTKYVGELKRDCQTRASEFEVETKDNKAELTALSKAKAILLKKFAAGALVQTKATTKARDVPDAEQDAKMRALRSIEQLGKRLHSTALVALSYRMAEDPFGKIRGMIEDMIAKLLQEAAEEATQKAFCDKELGESNAEKADKEGKLGKVNARLEKASSSTATLTEEVTILSKEVAENDAAMKTATEIRQKEKAAFKVVEKDLSESQEACAAATEVLREYYEGASLVQVSSKARAKSEVDAEGDGSGILGVLEVAESDFAKGLAEARTVEQQAQSEYDTMMQDGKMLKMTKEMEIKGKLSETKSLKTTITDLSSDKEGLTGELDAVLAYLDKLKPQCEVKVPSYAERKAAREQEIEGLKSALEILAPSFVQVG